MVGFLEDVEHCKSGPLSRTFSFPSVACYGLDDFWLLWRQILGPMVLILPMARDYFFGGSYEK